MRLLGVAGALSVYSIVILAWVLMGNAGLPNTTSFLRLILCRKRRRHLG